MKQILKNKIINIDNKNFDKKFLIKFFSTPNKSENRKIIFIEDLLKEKKNTELFKNIGGKYAKFSNVYSPEDELNIFKELFEKSIKNNQKIHIVGITLKEEIEILEKYYEELGFLRKDINCFEIDFNIPLVTTSVKIENLMRKGSDYKSQKEKIFFIPPPRESGQNKAMFKGLNRGTTAGIYISNWNEKILIFLKNSLLQEKILPLRLAEVLYFNYKDSGIKGEENDLIVKY